MHCPILQKVNLVRLGTLVLTATKEPKEYFANSDSTTEEICVGHVYGYKGIKERMDEIKAKFNLTDAVEWRGVIAEVGWRKRETGKDGKPRKIEGKKNGDKGKNKRPQNGAKKPQNGAKKPQNGAKKPQNGAKKSENETENTEKNSSPEENEQKEQPLKKKQTNGDGNEQPKQQKPPNKKNDKKKQEKKQLKPAQVEQPAVAVNATTEDAFFITADGGNYQATAVVDRVQPDGPDDGTDRRTRRAKQFGKPDRPVNKGGHNKRPAAPARTNGQNASNTGGDHPSWAAKRKQKTIPDFQGKKVKFGGNDGPAKKVGADTKSDDKNVHPSWAAKQKLKPVISEFKGSKITFDWCNKT